MWHISKISAHCSRFLCLRQIKRGERPFGSRDWRKSDFCRSHRAKMMTHVFIVAPERASRRRLFSAERRASGERNVEFRQHPRREGNSPRRIGTLISEPPSREAARPSVVSRARSCIISSDVTLARGIFFLFSLPFVGNGAVIGTMRKRGEQQRNLIITFAFVR